VLIGLSRSGQTRLDRVPPSIERSSVHEDGRARGSAESSKELRSFVIVALLNALPRGHEFRTDAWPLHVTLVPPFGTAAAASHVERVVEQVCRPFSPIDARILTGELFGRRRDVPVVTLEPSSALHDLHVRLLDALEPVAIGSAPSQHVRSGFRPHITDRAGVAPGPGSLVRLSHIAVVARDPAPAKGIRRLSVVIPLRP
jgi:hypothetical protein